MKNLAFTIALCLSTNLAFASQLDMKIVAEKSKQVLALQKAGNYQEAAIVAASTSVEIGNAIGVDAVVKNMQTLLTTRYQEVVTSRGSESFKMEDAFMLIKGTYYYDVARIVVTNPLEVARFDEKVQSDFRDLKSSLVSYVEKNQNQIAFMKAFAVKSLEMMSELSYEERSVIKNQVLTAWQKSQMLSFLGTQSVLRCTETNYADRSSGFTVSILGLNFKGVYSGRNSQYAYTESNCNKPTSASVTHSGFESAYSTLQLIDMLGKKYAQLIGKKDLVEAPDVLYPTWGSPHYK